MFVGVRGGATTYCQTCRKRSHRARAVRPHVEPRPTRAVLRLVTEYPDVDRPRTRGDCEAASRPCPFASCRHHLYLDVHPSTGSLKLNFPDVDPDEIPETCSLDVAARGGATLEELGHLLNLTRERVRQIEA